VRSQGAISTLDDLAAIVVGGNAEQPVRVADVAEVRLSALTRYGAVTRNGDGEAVEGLVLGLRGANARAVVRACRPSSTSSPPACRTASPSMSSTTAACWWTRPCTPWQGLVEAVVLVLVLLVLFLGDLRAALTVALILPLSALAPSS
jgi:cobalt-zinc-cadmium resistance protein CzcA